MELFHCFYPENYGSLTTLTDEEIKGFWAQKQDARIALSKWDNGEFGEQFDLDSDEEDYD